MGQTRNEYIHKLARTVAGQIGLRAEDWQRVSNWPSAALAHVKSHEEYRHSSISSEDIYAVAKALYQRYWDNVLSLVMTYSPETWGAIAVCGLPSTKQGQVTLADIRGNAHLALSEGGAYLLRHITALTIIAAMADNLVADIRKMR